MKSGLFLNRSIANIELSRITENYEIYKNCISDRSLIAVVKANAYGHGDVEISRLLEAEGVDYFAVSNINEGIRIRNGGIKGNILVLGYTPTALLPELSRFGLEQAIVSEDHLENIINCRVKNVGFHIALDLGMKRLGLSIDDPDVALNKIKNAADKIKLKGVFTHLPVADSRSIGDIKFTQREIDTFDNICTDLRGAGVEYFHCQNSAAGLGYRSKSANAVRVGILLYGYAPSKDVPVPKGIKTALSWKSLVCAVINVKKGEGISYGRSFIAEKNMRVATISTGYADGYPRFLSSKGYVIINGAICPIVGRICMDMMMVDVSDANEVRMGDEVVLIGESCGKKITADDLARVGKTISYEILTGISSRVERKYL